MMSTAAPTNPPKVTNMAMANASAAATRPAPAIHDPTPIKKARRSLPLAPVVRPCSHPSENPSPLQRLLSVPCPKKATAAEPKGDVAGPAPEVNEKPVESKVAVPEVIDLSGDDDDDDEVPSATVASMVRADRRSWSRKPATEKLLLASFQSRVVAKDAAADEKEKDCQTMAILSKKLYAIGDKLNDLVVTTMEEINDEELRDDPFLWESLMELSTNVYEAGTELELGYTNNE